MARERRQALIPIGDLARHGAKLAVWCQMCGRHRVLHVAPLIIRLGRSTPLDQVARQLKCSTCGSRRIEARPHYPGLGVVASHAAKPRKP